MVEVNAAWAVLGDPVSRGSYDRELARRMGATDPHDVDAEDFTGFVTFAGFSGGFDPDPEPRPYTPAGALAQPAATAPAEEAGGKSKDCGSKWPRPLPSIWRHASITSVSSR